MTGKLPRKPRDRITYINYTAKAEQFLKAMRECLKESNYDSAALNGVHAVISSIDALLVFKSGVVSASVNHEDAVQLLIELVEGDDTVKQAKHAYSVIRMKTIVEYADTRITEKQALEMEKHAVRLCDWVKSKLPKPM